MALSGDLNNDIEEMVRFKKTNHPWRWEMPLRGIRHHLQNNILKTVTFVCSNVSVEQVHWFKNFCGRYPEMTDITFYNLLKTHPKFVISSSESFKKEQGWNFESFDELSEAMSILLQIFKNHKFEEQDIMIDFTGGQKVTSVVAASITFNRKIKSQYVQTNPEWEVLSYDVIHAYSDTEGLGL